MSIISEVKCPRCDRRYSGIRGRCPYCGARRIGRGKHSTNSENARGKMIIGLLLMGVLIVAVVVLLVTSQGGQSPEVDNTGTPPVVNTGDDTISVTGNTVTPPPDTSPSPPDDDNVTPPVPVVESVTITYQGSKKEEFTCKIGEVVPLKAKVVPENTDERVEWSSSNEDVFIVTPETGTVTGIGNGTATLTVSVGGKTAECIVRVSKERANG